MPFRSGFIDEGGGFIGERPAPQMPPSLLQMAQGVAPQILGGGGSQFGGGPDFRGGGGFTGGGGGSGGGGGGPVPNPAFGEGWQSDPALNNGAPYRQITSPEEQNWSDAQGRPIHMGGPPPAYMPETTAGGYNAVFDPNAPSKDAGWFTMGDYLKQAPTPMEAATNPGSMQAPTRTRGGGASNKNALSTNNWRLLPENYRTPDYFMIDGDIVSRRDARAALAPKSILGQESQGFPGYYFQGAGQWSTPRGWASSQGYIGSQTPWAETGTQTY